MKEKDIADVYDTVVLGAKAHVGGEKAFSVLGPNLRRAVVALEILAFQHRMFAFFGTDDTRADLCTTVLALYGELNDQFPWEDQ